MEALFLVVRAEMTPDHLITEACTQLEGLSVKGIVLNQVRSWVPCWIRQML